MELMTLFQPLTMKEENSTRLEAICYKMHVDFAHHEKLRPDRHLNFLLYPKKTESRNTENTLSFGT